MFLVHIIAEVEGSYIVGDPISLDEGFSVTSQWVLEATASSEWPDTGFYADQMEGTPDVFPLHGE